MNIWTYEDVVSRSDYFALLDEFKPEFNHWAFNKREHNSYVLDGMKIKNRMGQIPYPTWGALTKASNRNAVDGLGDNTFLISIGEFFLPITTRPMTNIGLNFKYPFKK